MSPVCSRSLTDVWKQDAGIVRPLCCQQSGPGSTDESTTAETHCTAVTRFDRTTLSRRSLQGIVGWCKGHEHILWHIHRSFAERRPREVKQWLTDHEGSFLQCTYLHAKRRKQRSHISVMKKKNCIVAYLCTIIPVGVYCSMTDSTSTISSTNSLCALTSVRKTPWKFVRLDESVAVPLLQRQMPDWQRWLFISHLKMSPTGKVKGFAGSWHVPVPNRRWVTYAMTVFHGVQSDYRGEVDAH